MEQQFITNLNKNSTDIAFKTEKNSVLAYVCPLFLMNMGRMIIRLNKTSINGLTWTALRFTN
jgi:hypothetical protein